MDRNDEPPRAELTDALRAWQRGDPEAFEQIGPLIYRELRRLAAFHLKGERPDHTLHPTDLISEVYLKVAGGAELQLRDRRHFFAIASRCMRQILIDHARRRGAHKRDAADHRFTLDEPWRSADHTGLLLALDDAIRELEQLDERKARVVELHYFGGLTHDEIAATCEVHVNTVARDLRFSEAWLRRRLLRDNAAPSA
jgi:RNA polymerase sigma factor (TIGR02999 family)